MALTSRIDLLSTILLCGFIALTSRVSHAQLVVDYDNFDGQVMIDGNKWFGNEQSGGTDIIRRVQNGELVLAFGAWGNTDSDEGQANLRNRLRFNEDSVDLSSVTTVVFDGTIDALVMQDCPGNPLRANAELRWIREFFNDGSSTGPDDLTGNIGAVMRMIRFPDGTNSIETSIYRCTNADCSEDVDLHGASYATEWSLGEKQVLAVRWEPENDLFRFVLNPFLPGQELIVGSYSGFSDSDPPVGQFMYIGNRVRAPNCTTGRKQAAILSRVDNVQLNPTAILPSESE